MDAVGICPNGTSTNMESPHSAVPPTETPPPGYMSEDGDPIDPNDNMSKICPLYGIAIIIDRKLGKNRGAFYNKFIISS